MKRHLKLKGILLSSWRLQEYNRGIKIFTPEEGLLNIIAFGAFRPKSRLGSLLQPVTYGEFNIYHDPVKKLYRITDYEPYHDYTGIKQDLKKYYSALLWFEIIMKSHAGGESGKELFILLKDSLKTLDKCSGSIIEKLMNQFLLRTVNFFTGPFQLNECSNCGTMHQANDEIYFSLRDLNFVCRNCSNTENTVINPGVKKYIDYSVNQVLDISLKSGIDAENQKKLKIFLYTVIQEYIEEQLLTLKTGREFLF